MAFFETQLPPDVERGAIGGPRFKTTVIPLNSGHERRNEDWSKTRGDWNVGYGISLVSQLSAVIAFFYAMNGRAHGFLFKDWSDFQIGNSVANDATTRQSIGLTDGSTATFQIYKRYIAGSALFDREITRPASGTLRVFVDGVERTEGVGATQYQVDLTTGIITIGATLLALSGPAVEVLTQFNVPVRFDTDELDINTEVFLDEAALSVPRIPIKEIRVGT